MRSPYQMIVVVVGWHVYRLTHDPFALGLAGLAEVIPYFCCALFAGYVIDHHSRRMFGVLASMMSAAMHWCSWRRRRASHPGW